VLGDYTLQMSALVNWIKEVLEFAFTGASVSKWLTKRCHRVDPGSVFVANVGNTGTLCY